MTRHLPILEWERGRLVQRGCPCGPCELRRLKWALAVIVACCAVGAALVVAACRVL